MCQKRVEEFTGEDKKLVELFESNPTMTMHQVIEKYASDEYKAMLNEPEEDDWEPIDVVLEQ